MNFNLTVNEDCAGQSNLDGAATHQVRVHYNESDAGQVTGPFTLAGARQAAIVALSKPGVLKATVEAIS